MLDGGIHIKLRLILVRLRLNFENSSPKTPIRFYSRDTFCPSEALQWFFPESKAVLDMLGWTEEQFWAEVEFVEKVLQTHTDQNENSTSIRMCHNDLHPGKFSVEISSKLKKKYNFELKRQYNAK